MTNKSFILIFSLIIFISLFSNVDATVSGTQLWNLTYNLGGTDVAYSVDVDSFDNTYVVGNADTDWYVMKFNSSGSQLWNLTYNLGGSDYASSVSADNSSSGIYVIGSGGATNDWYIFNLNSSGSQLWNLTYNLGGIDYVYSVDVDNLNNFYVAGIAGGTSDWYVMKFNSSGSQLWNLTYNLGGTDVAYSVSVDNSSSNIYVAGYGGASNDWYIFNLNSSGSQLWNLTYNLGGSDYADSVSITSSNNFYVAGYGGASNDWYVMKFNSSGSQLWNLTYNLGGTDVAQSVSVDNSSSNIYVAGNADSDWYVMKFNSSGSQLWNVTYDLGGSDSAFSVSVDNSNNAYVVGYGNLAYDWYIIKLQGVSDSPPYLVSFGNGVNPDFSNLSQSNIFVNVTSSDTTYNIDTIMFYLYNSTSLVNNTNISVSGSLINSAYLNFTGLPNGIYYFNATSNNTIGLINSTLSATRTITLDTVYPQISFGLLTDTDFSNFSRSWVYANVSASDIYEKNITFNLYNTTGLVNSTTYSASTRLINWTSLPNNLYYYNVTSTDYSGNKNTTATRTITLDTISPVVTSLSPSAGTSSTTNYYNFTFNVSDTNSVSSCSLYFDGVIIQSLSSISKDVTLGMYNSSLSIAVHSWNVSCTDIAGNVGNGSTRILIISSTPTAATSTSPVISGAFPETKDVVKPVVEEPETLDNSQQQEDNNIVNQEESQSLTESIQLLLAEADAPQVELVDGISTVPESSSEPVIVQLTPSASVTGNVVSSSSFIISRSNNEQAELTMNVIADNVGLEKPTLNTNFKVVELKKQIPIIKLNTSNNLKLSIIVSILALLFISIFSISFFKIESFNHKFKHNRKSF